MLIFVFISLSILELGFSNSNPLSDKFIESINSAQNTWKAGRNFHPNTPMAHIESYLGRKNVVSKIRLPPNRLTPEVDNLPDNFDARKEWPKCSRIGTVYDQGPCSSSWALAAASTMSDRICIFTGQFVNVALSARNVLACSDSGGCDGGDAFGAWNYWVHSGVVTGGAYNSKEGCQTYHWAPCEHNTTGHYPPCGPTKKTPDCSEFCEPYSDLSYFGQIYRGAFAYSVEGDERNIRSEIFLNGPIEAVFDVYEDFLNYKSGVYRHVKGNYIAQHAVKILGWGTENNTAYWLALNSWNEDWGDGGLFKIERNSNECGIEKTLLAGIPEVMNP